MKPLLILSLLAICAGCKEKPPVVAEEPLPKEAFGNISFSKDLMIGNRASFVKTHVFTEDQLDEVIKAVRLLAAHADPSPQVYVTEAVVRSRSQELLIEAKRQEAREAEYAWAKSVLTELEKRK